MISNQYKSLIIITSHHSKSAASFNTLYSVEISNFIIILLLVPYNGHWCSPRLVEPIFSVLLIRKCYFFFKGSFINESMTNRMMGFFVIFIVVFFSFFIGKIENASTVQAKIITKTITTIITLRFTNSPTFLIFNSSMI